MSHALERNATPAPVPAGSAGSPARETSRSAADSNGDVPNLWQELLSATPANSVQEWLHAAGPEGILYRHRLRASPQPRCHAAANVLAGRTEDLEPFSAHSAADFAWFDQELDDAQREAVSQALASPDLFLIQGNPGTGKSRVVAEIITQAARRGERVLLLSTGRGALDRVLGLLGDRHDVLAVRCVGPQEDVSRLPAEVRRHTHVERSRSFSADLQRRAEQRCRAAEQEIEVARRERDLAAKMRPLAPDWETLEGERQALLAQRQRIAEHVEKEGSSAELRSQLEAEGARHRQALDTLEGKQAEAEAACRQVGAEHGRWMDRVAAQEGFVAARARGRWFSLRYWRALLQGRPEQRLEEFRQRAAEIDQARQQGEANLLDIKQQGEFELQRHHVAVQQIQQTEITRRQGEVDAALRQSQAGQRQLEAAWESQRSQLRKPASVSALPSTPAAQALYQDAHQRIHQAQRAAEFAKRWLRTLAEIADQLPGRFLEAVNLVAAGAADIAHDSTFGDRAAQPPQFDLLILEQADRWPESELLAHVKRANRCILVGQTPLPEPAGSARAAPRHVSAFHRLWEALHCDPRRLPYLWLEDADRLTCRLQPIVVEQQSHVEVERLVDHPEVELHIVARSQAAPTLAEVVFPANKFTIQSAKAYLYQQLGELALRPTAAALRWRSENGALWLETSGAPPAALVGQRVELEEGVCEVVAGGHSGDNGRTPMVWSTLRLEFDGDKGWDRTRAEAWLRERAGWQNLGRTALLETQYRACAPIAEFCSEVLGESAIRTGARSGRLMALGDLKPGVQCFAVPYQREQPRPRTRGPQRPGPPQTKSFEIDLSDAKQRQRVPVDLQLKLPAKGLVNFAEAQAIIHWLDVLARAPQLAQRSESEPVSIAVLSWQAPQVQFLQSLWTGAEADRQSLRVRFETIAAFRDQEADIVLISLCRSNAQRVVGFADYPEEWRWALSAARTALLIFGDLDAVGRRAHWTGAVNRQTETSAACERAIVQRLRSRFVCEPRRAPAPQGVRK